MDADIDFLNVLAAHPGDDAAWLVYADWLEERGEDRADFLRGVVAFSQGLPLDKVESAARRLGRITPSLPESWVGPVLHLWRTRPSRLRIVDIQYIGNDPPQDMFERTMTHLHCVLESGRVRLGDEVVIPLEDGGFRCERVTCLFDWRQTGYRELGFGQKPLVFGLMWSGHRRGALRGGKIVPG
jgi:uncharacterized protein (TIGR02996 family)